MSKDTPQDFYGGLSGVELEFDSFDLGHGITLSKTYAHLMSPLLMAFAPPTSRGIHPAPWSAAKGGFGYDIRVQIHVPASFNLSNWMDRTEVLWWITALIRIIQAPFAMLPVMSDIPFSEVPNSGRTANLQPMETQRRIFSPGKDNSSAISAENLDWIRDTWFQGGELMKMNSKFNTAFRAFDSSAVQGKPSLSMISLWGGIEQLFSPSPGELRFRVSAMLASYLEQPGAERLQLYKKIIKLYNARSTAAHTANETDNHSLLATWVLMRNALVKILHNNYIPTREDLEEYLFGLKAPPSW
jgi:hypothetical protein